MARPPSCAAAAVAVLCILRRRRAARAGRGRRAARRPRLQDLAAMDADVRPTPRLTRLHCNSLALLALGDGPGARRRVWPLPARVPARPRPARAHSSTTASDHPPTRRRQPWRCGSPSTVTQHPLPTPAVGGRRRAVAAWRRARSRGRRCCVSGRPRRRSCSPGALLPVARARALTNHHERAPFLWPPRTPGWARVLPGRRERQSSHQAWDLWAMAGASSQGHATTSPATTHPQSCTEMAALTPARLDRAVAPSTTLTAPAHAPTTALDGPRTARPTGQASRHRAVVGARRQRRHPPAFVLRSLHLQPPSNSAD